MKLIIFIAPLHLGQVSGSTSFRLNEKSWTGRFSWNTEWSKGLELGLGADVDHRKAQIAINAFELSNSYVPMNLDTPLAVGTFSGAWLALTWKSGNWTTVLGGRADYYHLVPAVSELTLEPRITVRRRFFDGSLVLKAAAGIFHQAPSTLIQVPTVDLAGLQYGVQKSAQFNFGAEFRFRKAFEVSVDLYFNSLLRTVEINPFDPGATAHARVQQLDGTRIPDAKEMFSPEDVVSSGWSYGMEWMVRRPLGGNWFGWLSYSLQKSVRKVRYTIYDNNGNYQGSVTGYLPYAFQQTHLFNAAISYKLPANWTVGAVFHFHTGRPESGVMTSSTMLPGEVYDQEVWLPVSRDKVDSLPSFFRVDLRVAKSWMFDFFP